MNSLFPSHTETMAALAFNRQSIVFDDIYAHDSIIKYKRDRVRQHVARHLPASDAYILELNAGTGEDAVYFAQKGHRVHATDVSSGMLSVLREKIDSRKLNVSVTYELCAYTQLHNLVSKGPYDFIFSNFAGLNCTDQLDTVLRSLPSLLKKGGLITLVILPKFCLWEFLLLFKGKFKTAFRRFSGSRGTMAHVEGTYFACHYYNPLFVIKHLGDDFEVLSIEGLCTFVPPSYIKSFAEKYPGLYRVLCSMEKKFRSYKPWRSIGDYYIISLRKK
jgi:ubiquinone/menaquinone biosynthesis C-methylase UbiE